MYYSCNSLSEYKFGGDYRQSLDTETRVHAKEGELGNRADAAAVILWMVPSGWSGWISRWLPGPGRLTPTLVQLPWSWPCEPALALSWASQVHHRQVGPGR